jgi:hypothetical protein
MAAPGAALEGPSFMVGIFVSSDNFDKVPEDQAIICVIDTIRYEVASYAYSRQEFSLLDDHSDFRKRTWLLMDKAKANQVSGFGKLEDH